MKKTFTCKPSATATKKVVKAATDTAENMLDAFEERLAELSVRSKTDVSCATEDEELDERKVEIYEDDYEEKYEDVEGCFGDQGEIYTLSEIKEFWNNEHNNDPILVDYPSFKSWWADTRSNCMSPVYDD